jgi:hypothetical protein
VLVSTLIAIARAGYPVGIEFHVPYLAQPLLAILAVPLLEPSSRRSIATNSGFVKLEIQAMIGKGSIAAILCQISNFNA